MSASNSSAPRAKVVTVSSSKNKGPGLGVQLLTAGTAACIADVITFPLDTVKVRLQVKTYCNNVPRGVKNKDNIFTERVSEANE